MCSGSGANIPYGSGAGKFQKAVENTGAKVSSLSFVYSDAGLIGANIVAPKEQAGKVRKPSPLHLTKRIRISVWLVALKK